MVRILEIGEGRGWGRGVGDKAQLGEESKVSGTSGERLISHEVGSIMI